MRVQMIESKGEDKRMEKQILNFGEDEINQRFEDKQGFLRLKNYLLFTLNVQIF